MAEEPPPGGDILPNYPYTTRQAAALLQLHPKTLLERRSAGLLRGYREGRTWRFRGQWLIDYMERQVPGSGRAQPGPPPKIYYDPLPE